MCGCAAYHVCDLHTDMILRGLAAARDFADAGHQQQGADLLAQLRADHGRKVDEVIRRVDLGALDLAAYGKQRSNR